MRPFTERSVPYLTAVRAACESVIRAPQDASAQRKLEQVCEVLSALIADAKAGPSIEARGLEQFNRVLPQGAVDFPSARALAAKLIAASEGSADPSAIEFARRAVGIDAEYFQSLARALGADARSAAHAENAKARSDLPDAAAISEYLSREFAQPVEVLAINTASLGYSKATYLIDVRSSGDVPTALVIRMDRAVNFLGTTVVDEYPILKTLYESGVSVPRPYAVERTGGVLGQPFLVVSRVYGRNVGSHFSFPPKNLELCREFAATLAQIHRIPVMSFGSGLRGVAETPEEQMAAEIARYRADWSVLEAVSPTMEAAFQWIDRHAHEAVGPRTLIHGDFSLSNSLISDEGKIGAILDWEFTQVGPPAADVGWFYTAAEHLASFTEFLDAYRAAGAPEPPKRQLDFFILWGMVRLAVMNYQVETGFEQGRMRDIRQASVAVTFSRIQVQRVAAYLTQLLAAEAGG